MTECPSPGSRCAAAIASRPSTDGVRINLTKEQVRNLPPVELDVQEQRSVVLLLLGLAISIKIVPRMTTKAQFGSKLMASPQTPVAWNVL